MMKTVHSLQGVSQEATLADKAFSNQETWTKALQAWHKWQVPMPPQDFCQQLACTSLQVLAWCRLLKEGATTTEASPAELGFWTYALINPSRKPAGLTPLPCLTWECQEWRYIIWPQIRICDASRAYQLDALALVAGWNRCQWLALHLDGQQNRWDDQLPANMKLPLVRLDRRQLKAEHWLVYVREVLRGYGQRTW